MSRLNYDIFIGYVMHQEGCREIIMKRFDNQVEIIIPSESSLDTIAGWMAYFSDNLKILLNKSPGNISEFYPNDVLQPFDVYTLGKLKEAYDKLGIGKSPFDYQPKEY